jgi:flagellar motor switch protein FliM
MGQILSQSEVESILSALDLQADSPQSPQEMPTSQPVDQASLYDFEHPEPLRRSQLDALRLASASASQSLQTSLSQVLQSPFVVKFLGVEQSTYRDYLATAESPCCIAVLESNSSTNFWLLDISRSLAFTFIDCMLGGRPFDTQSAAIPCRTYTDVETRLIDRVIRAVLPYLAGSYTQRTSLTLSRLVSDTSVIAEASSNESVALVSFEVLCGSKQGLMQLCVPWRQIAKAGITTGDDGRDLREVMRSGAVKIPVIATAHIARLKLSTRDLASLSSGDILMTDASPSDEIILEVDGCQIFRGNPGQSQNHKVIRLTTPVAPSTAKNRSDDTPIR